MANSQNNATLPTNLSSEIPKSKSAEFCRLGNVEVRRIGFGTKRLARPNGGGGGGEGEGKAPLTRAGGVGGEQLRTPPLFPRSSLPGETGAGPGRHVGND